VVFVTDSLPGERVIARITDDEHASFWRADTVRVLEASPHRVPHVWQAASIDRDPDDRAGGAEFGHIDLSWQRELKRQVIVDSLKRFAGLERDVEVEAVDGDDERGGLGWRTRVRLHVDADGRAQRAVPAPEVLLRVSQWVIRTSQNLKAQAGHAKSRVKQNREIGLVIHATLHTKQDLLGKQPYARAILAFHAHIARERVEPLRELVDAHWLQRKRLFERLYSHVSFSHPHSNAL
jgi:tRNA/tmRNA/rRNA uracil-C5-methylase (TrmA/RlmC/RlmD family)